jgi:biopolymer transport protein ExbB
MLDIESVFMKFALLGADWVLWLLSALSIISLGVMIERAIYLIRGRLDMGAAATDLTRALDDGGSEGVRKAFSARLNAPEARILMAGVEKHEGGAESVERAMNARRAVEKTRLERNLAFLGTLGPTAPFIGLFGTVLGIIGAFHGLALNTQGGIGVVMANLSEALVATAAGLLVAIPAVIIYNVFVRLVARRMAGASVLSSLYLSWLQSRQRDED